MTELNKLTALFKKVTGSEPNSVTEMPLAGSNRRYFRLSDHTYSLIGVLGNCQPENDAFIYIDQHFYRKGLPVPMVYAVSEDRMAYIQEDLGSTLLFDAIAAGRKSRCFGPVEKELLTKTIRMLPAIQFEGAKGMDFSKCYPSPEFDSRLIMWDLNYFKYCFLKATGLEFSEELLEDDFVRMSEKLMEHMSDTFMYRDFQSRNVMIKDGNPHFIDFQGGRKGPFYYDVASFLWQAKANFPDSLRLELIKEYIDAMQTYKKVDEEEFLQTLRHFVLFRNLQVLGAYGFRGYFEKKPHFITSIPFAVANLRELLKTPYEEYPYMQEVLNNLVNMKQFTDVLDKKALKVKVMSFAYKKGIPQDATGNGGGYVFDCRAINNPGKYERYKTYTGLDAPVIKYLEDDGEILTFLSHVYPLVDSTVRRYRERGFTDLMVCFGCTGGQHRSVYCAQKLAEHLNNDFGVKVELIHREQDIEQTFKAKEIESTNN